MDENKKRIILHKISIIENEIKIMKDTMFDMKIEMNEIKKLIMEIVSNNNDTKEINKSWFGNIF